MKKVKIIQEFLGIQEGEIRHLADDIARDLIARELAVEEAEEEVIDYKERYETQLEKVAHFDKENQELKQQLAQALAKIAELEKPVVIEVKEEKAATVTKELKTPKQTKAK